MSRSSAILLLCILFAVAWFTSPSEEKFKTYTESVKSPEADMPPIASYNNYHLFCLGTVQYYHKGNESNSINIKVAADTSLHVIAKDSLDSINDKINNKVTVAVPVSKATYLGLFGHFFKIG